MLGEVLNLFDNLPLAVVFSVAIFYFLKYYFNYTISSNFEKLLMSRDSHVTFKIITEIILVVFITFFSLLFNIMEIDTATTILKNVSTWKSVGFTVLLIACYFIMYFWVSSIEKKNIIINELKIKKRFVYLLVLLLIMTLFTISTYFFGKISTLFLTAMHGELNFSKINYTMDIIISPDFYNNVPLIITSFIIFILGYIPIRIILNLHLKYEKILFHKDIKATVFLKNGNEISKVYIYSSVIKDVYFLGDSSTTGTSNKQYVIPKDEVLYIELETKSDKTGDAKELL